MARRRRVEVEATGSVFLDMTEHGETVEASSYLNIAITDTEVIWVGRRDLPPVVDHSPEARWFARRALYALRPRPTLSRGTAVPKPKRRQPRLPFISPDVCDVCAGAGLVVGASDVESWLTCDTCEGTGLPPAAAEH